MTMFDNLRKVTRGAKVQSYKSVNPRSLLYAEINSNKYPLTCEGRELCESTMFDENYQNEEFMKAVFSYWHANNWHAIVTDKRNQHLIEQRRKSLEVQKEEKTKEVNETKQEIRTLTNRYLTLSLWETMPNGKPLAECTGEELREIKGFYQKALQGIIKRIKPDQKVSDVLTEDDLHEYNQQSALTPLA